MTAQQADDATYRASKQRNAAAMYPEDPAEFRANWGSETVTVAWIKDATNTLSDPEITDLSTALRGALLTGKADLTEIWQLAALKAGVL